MKKDLIKVFEHINKIRIQAGVDDTELHAALIKAEDAIVYTMRLIKRRANTS